jgi:hypothetical protein
MEAKESIETSTKYLNEVFNSMPPEMQKLLQLWKDWGYMDGRLKGWEEAREFLTKGEKKDD